jgi:hypothetical protein
MYTYGYKNSGFYYEVKNYIKSVTLAYTRISRYSRTPYLNFSRD